MDYSKLSSKFPCPHCGNPIHMTMEVLLHGHIASCMGCGSTLSVDRQTSAGALQALQTALTKINNIPGNALQGA